MTLSVLMATEGTYPYAAGGVSTWCDALLRNTPDVLYTLLPVREAVAEVMWAHSRRIAEALPRDAREHQMPTLFDLTESLRWLYRFLIVLNIRTPQTDVTHTTAAAFCGIPCITAKVRRGT